MTLFYRIMTGTAFCTALCSPAQAAPTPVDQNGQSGPVDQPQSTEAKVIRPSAVTAADDIFGDIVVTARRRAETLQSVPVAITALSNDALAQRSITSVDQLRTAAPALNISAQDRGEATFYIRGQGPGIVGGGQRSFTSVATYFAEVPTPIAGTGQLYDLTSVQVLKGPQGTLFGRNTTGGAVLFEPNRPTWEFGGYLKASYGNYDYKEVEAALNLPIVQDILSVRVAADLARRDGFTRSVLTNQRLDSRNNDSYRVSVLLTPAAGLENLTIVDSNYRNNSGSGLILTQVYPSATVGSVPLGPGFSLPLRVGSPADSFIGCLSFALPGCAPGGAAGAVGAAIANGGFGLSGVTPDQFRAALAQQQALGVRNALEPALLYRRIRDFGITNKTSFAINDNITLKNIVSFRKQKIAEVNNISGPFKFLNSVYPGNSVPYVRGFEQITEEFQVQGKSADLGLAYIIGYYHEQAKPGFRQSYRSNGFGTITNTHQDYNDKSDAVFAHAELNITPKLQISGGIRHTWDKRYALSTVTFDDGSCNQVDPATGILVCPASGKARFRALTGDATVQYKITPSVLTYLSYRHGYKSGGFNLPAPTADTSVFRPETVNDIELGLKADWDIGFPLRTNISVFRDKYKDIQIALPLLVNNAVISAIQNAASAINKGFELEATVVPVRGVTLSGYASYLSAECQVDAGAACRRNRQIAYQPRWKYGVSGVVKLPVDPANITLAADYSFTSKVTTSDPDARSIGLSDTYPGYGIVNARLEWRDAIRPGLDLSLFATNITDKVYIVGGYPLASFLGISTALFGDPRTYGASIRFRFGADQ
jgi:iron complex outermembrane receptor protein